MIKQLQELVAEYGDLEVIIADGSIFYSTYKVVDVNYSDGAIEIGGCDA